MRPIDADALLKELRKSCEYHAENGREFSLLQRDIIIVQEQPTVDAVPVIRCKDCKHWDGVDTCDVIDAPVWDNDFCSMAERRSDE